jgi:hypothetical protein
MEFIIMKILNHYKMLTIVVMSLILSNHEAHAWDPDKTHNLIAEYAVQQSVLSADKGDYLWNLGYTLNYGTSFQLATANGSVKKQL